MIASGEPAGRKTAAGTPWLDRIPVGAIAAVETLFLGVLAAALVLYAFPHGFDIGSQCVGPTGLQTTAGDTYIAAVAVVGTLGWIGVFVGIVFSSIAERRGLVLALPIAWFVALVVPALIAAALLGPEPCPS